MFSNVLFLCYTIWLIAEISGSIDSHLFFNYQVLYCVLNAKALELIQWTTSMDNLKLADYVGFAGTCVELSCATV